MDRTNTPAAPVVGTHATIEIRNGWHVVRDRFGDVAGKRLTTEEAVRLAHGEGNRETRSRYTHGGLPRR